MKPILKALLLADHVYEDRAAGKKIIAGTINTVVLSDVELHAFAYISLTEVHRPTRLRLKYIDLLDARTLREFEIRLTAGNPLAIIEVVVPFQPLPTPHVGRYVLDLLVEEGNELGILGSHRLRIVDRKGDNE